MTTRCLYGGGILTRFETVGEKIFNRDKIDIYVLSLPHTPLLSGSTVLVKNINNLQSLLDHLERSEIDAYHEEIILVPQEYSWGRFTITRSAFQVIIKAQEAFVDFLDVVAAYGVKTREDERAFYGWRCCAHRRQCSKSMHEICYNVPYVDKHGRDLRDPWSLRQTGVYQQLRVDMQTSKWILLNLADQVRSHIEQLTKSKSRCCRMALHTELLALLGSNWQEYTEFLTSELRKHNDKACYSNVDQVKPSGYTISYSDLQELHMLQTKIHRAEAAVESCLNIERGCQSYFESHSPTFQHSPMACNECKCSLDMYTVEMSRHLENLKRLNLRSQDSLNLLSKILMFRNEVLLQLSNRASGETLRALLGITEQGRGHQETLTQLLGTGQADSALLKALSIVATVCLPASLIATVFSSNLIQSVTQGQRHPPDSKSETGNGPTASHLVLSPQFWVYTAITLPLMGLTLAWTLYLDRRSHRRAAAAGMQYS